MQTIQLMSASLHEIIWRSYILNPHIRTWQLGWLFELCWAELMNWWVYSLFCLSFSCVSFCLFLSVSLCQSVCVSLSLLLDHLPTQTQLDYRADHNTSLQVSTLVQMNLAFLFPIPPVFLHGLALDCWLNTNISVHSHF